MKVLLDENIPIGLGHALTRAGFAVRTMGALAPRAPDDWVLAEATREAEIVITSDKDFGELVWQREQHFHGVILLRVHPVSDHIAEIVDFMETHRDELQGSFVVIAANRTRIRHRGPTSLSE